MLVGKVIENESEIVNIAKELADFSDENFKNIISSASFCEKDGDIALKFFYLHAYSSNEEIKNFFKLLNFPSERTELFISQLELWRKNEPALRTINDSERENLLDLQWKLMARAGGTESEKLYVQLELLVEKNEQLKKHHLELDVPKFYDLLQEFTKANHSLQEIIEMKNME